MKDLQNPILIWLKGGLFLLLGILASALILIENPSLRLVAPLAIAIWAFCRSYYFAFYVIEHYVDGNYRYAGLVSFLRYALGGSAKRVET